MASLGHPCKFQRVSRLGSVTARHSNSRRQPNCGVEQRALPVVGRAAITLGIGPLFKFFLFFGRPFVKRSDLCYQTVVCLSCPVCLSVTLVHYGQTVGWIKMKPGTRVGLGPGHIEIYPLPQRGIHPTIFGPYLLRPNGCMDQDVTN